MPNPNYRRGADKERDYERFLTACGWEATRTPKSGGGRGYDIMAIHPDFGSLLVEVKAGKRPYQDFPPAERKALLDRAKRVGARALLVWYPKGGGPVELEPAFWPPLS